MKTSSYLSWRLVCFFLALALMLLSAGCSDRRPSVDTPEPNTSEEGLESTVITFAADEYMRRTYEPLMETFHEQNPEITVQFVDVSLAFPSDDEWNQDTYFRSLAQAADTIMLSGPFDLDMSGYFRDLRPLYEADAAFEPDDFWPGILSACEDSSGNVAGLPMAIFVNGVFYDEAAFDAAGIPHPKPGWTWDEFQTAVNALAGKEGGQVKYGFYDSPYLSGSILAPVVIDHLNSNGGEADGAALLNEVMWYIDLAQAEMLSGIQSEENFSDPWEERMKLFEVDALRPAMWVDALISSDPTGQVEYDTNNPYSGMTIDRFGFAPFPVSADGSSTQTSRSWVECAAVSAGSLNPRAAWAWLNFLSRQWAVNYEANGYEIARAPARQSVAEATGFFDLLPEKAVAAVRYALEHGSYDYPDTVRFYEINLALTKTIFENADFVQALETAVTARMVEMPALRKLTENAPIVVATPLPPLKEGATVVKYLLNEFNQNEMNALKTLVQQYNERSPDAQVILITDFQGSPDEDWFTSMTNEFDCFTASAPYWESFDVTRVLNLTPLLNNELASFTNDFSPEMMDNFRYEGNLYGLPSSRRMQMMAYNSDLLARRGLPVPENDWTFDDFIELASAAASTSQADPSYGYSYSPYDDFIISGRGVKWVDYYSNPPRAFLDSPEMLDYLTWLVKMEQDNVLLNSEENPNEMYRILSSGQLAFWSAWMGDENMGYMMADQEQSVKVGVAPIPRNSGAKSMAFSGYDRGHFISAQSQAPQVCWDWIKFLSEQPTLFSGLPARLSIAESSAWEASVGRENAAAYRAASVHFNPFNFDDLEIPQILYPLNQWRMQADIAALEGQDIQLVLAAQQQKAETYLACALALDASKPREQLDQDVLACLRQADPEGGW